LVTNRLRARHVLDANDRRRSVAVADGGLHRLMSPIR
jgi:hypothetical protein